MGNLEKVKKKIECLVVDTSAFINNAALQEIGENIITVPEVINEIKSKRQLRRLVVLPYDLTVKEAFPENIKFVTEFSKKTGDYPSLSATDINVIALTYQLEKEKNGTSHLKEAPVGKPSIEPTSRIPEDLKNIVGFHLPKKGFRSQVTSKNNSEDEEGSSEYDSAEDGEFDFEKKEEWSDVMDSENLKNHLLKNLTEVEEKDEGEENENGDGLGNIDEVYSGKGDEEDCEADIDEDEDDEGDDDDDDDDDDSGWITPGNIEKVKNKMASELIEDFENVSVACLTTDYAMQNVLKQIGLQVVTIDGKLIKYLRTFILRCYGCFKTTSIMTKVFCPNCGNKTLKKVAVSLNPDGTQRIHINFRKPLTARGKRFSLPRPKGGKHSNNPILCEDQPIPQQRPSRLSRMKNNPLNDDYIAGYSPFVTRDVYSKSAMLGIKPHLQMKHWMRKNPNESRKKKK